MAAWVCARGVHHVSGTQKTAWTAGLVDDILHRERAISAPSDPSPIGDSLATLPEGTFVSLSMRGAPTTRADAWMCWRGHLLRWSHEGYCERLPMSDVDEHDKSLALLTPRSMVEAMRCGFVPGAVHPSAEALFVNGDVQVEAQ